MDLLIAGDFFVSDRYRGRALWDPSISALFAAADLRILNVEAPITGGAKRDRILKVGPHLGAGQGTVLPLLTGLGIDLVTLANNHIMDFGVPGLAETLTCLDAAGIRTVGAGLDLAQASKPYLIETGAGRLAILNIAENEFASAWPGRAGANPMDLIDNVAQIREARANADHVVVIIHGGQEGFPYPTPRMAKLYRFYAENGASVIVGHHTHCVSGYEVHKGTPIFYGLGNFLFTLPGHAEPWYRGLVLRLRLDKSREPGWELIPVAQAKDDFTLTRLEGEAREIADREIEDYRQVIADPAALRKKWEGFLSANGRFYLNIFNPVNGFGNRLFRAALFRLHLDRLLTRRGQYAEILNIIRCEAHAEGAQQSIQRMLE